MIKVLLGREIPSGGLPSDIGVSVFNVATLAQIGELLPRRQGLIERVITVSGPAVVEARQLPGRARHSHPLGSGTGGLHRSGGLGHSGRPDDGRIHRHPSTYP